jgi:acetyl esterase/lipase
MKLLWLLYVAITATLLHVVSVPAQTSLPGSSQDSFNNPGGSTASGNVVVRRDIPYVANGHVRQTLDLYMPTAGRRPVPLVVWVHGGAWKLGSKDWINVKYLLQQGYAIASVDYRFSGDAKFPAQIQDCNTALNFLVAKAASYGIDPKRLVVGGGSAGGHLALLLGLARRELSFGADPSIQPLAILDFFGPVDFISLLEEVDQAHEREEAEDVFHRLLGASPAMRPDLARLASPITYIGRGSPPVLMLHGDKDASVPYRQSQELQARLTQAGISNELITVKGVGHDGPVFATPELQERVISFLRSPGLARPVTNVKP